MVTRKAEAGESGNGGQFAHTQRSESVSVDVDGDGKPDGELDLVREGEDVFLRGSVTISGSAQEVNERVGGSDDGPAAWKDGIEKAVKGLAG